VIRLWWVGKMRFAATSGDPLTRPKVEMGREDGNLIRGEGIFLGKGRDGRKCGVCWRCRLRPEHEFGS